MYQSTIDRTTIATQILQLQTIRKISKTIKMAFKYILISTILAVASAGIVQPITYSHVVNPAVDAVASTHQNVVRNFDGTVSQYSKTIETPYSSVHKHDTRVNNNLYQPVVAKTALYTHAAPAVYATPAQTTHYVHSTPMAKTVATYVAPAITKGYVHAIPASKTVYSSPSQASHEVGSSPIVAKTVTYAAPAQVYQQEVPITKHITYASPAPVYHHSAPVESTSTTTYNHGPAATTYTHNAPDISAYGASQTVHYLPANTASHMSFDGFGTHWGW